MLVVRILRTFSSLETGEKWLNDPSYQHGICWYSRHTPANKDVTKYTDTLQQCLPLLLTPAVADTASATAFVKIPTENGGEQSGEREGNRHYGAATISQNWTNFNSPHTKSFSVASSIVENLWPQNLLKTGWTAPRLHDVVAPAN